LSTQPPFIKASSTNLLDSEAAQQGLSHVFENSSHETVIFTDQDISLMRTLAATHGFADDHCHQQAVISAYIASTFA